MVGEWFSEYGNLKENTIFYHQYQEAEKHNKTLPNKIKYPTYHSQEVWHSKPINTKRIIELYQASKDLELDLNNFNLEELNLQETLTKSSEKTSFVENESPQEQFSLQANIQIPPKS